MMMVTADRQEISQAVAKAIAFKQCGKDREAELWAARLLMLLDCHGILDLDDRRISDATITPVELLP